MAIKEKKVKEPKMPKMTKAKKAVKKGKKVVGQAAQLKILVRNAFCSVGAGVIMLLLTMLFSYFLSSTQAEQL